jgi:hypothetical protein
MEPELQQLSVLNAAMAELGASTRMLRQAGYSVAADTIMKQATRTTGPPVAVFVGESGKGKSSLVDLIAPCFNGPGEEPGSGGLYRLVTPQKGDDDVPVWVYPDGSRSSTRHESMHPIGVEVQAPSCALDDTFLVDAPNAGGLEGAQSLLNLKVLESASIAVFVTDAGAVLSKAELAYLEECSARVEAIAVAVTKTDLYPSSWKQTVAGNISLLERRLPRLAGSYVAGVSVPMAAAAAKIGNPAQSLALAEASGYPQLLKALKRELIRAGSAPTANALRLARTALELHRQSLLARIATMGVDPGTDAAMQTERQRLADLKEEQQRWTLDLERDLGELRASVMRTAGVSLDSWSNEWRNRIQSTKRLRDAKTAQQLTNQIFAELQTIRGNAVTDAEERLQRLVRSSFRDVSLPEVLGEVLSSSSRPDHNHQLGSERQRVGFDPSMAISLMMGASMGGAAAGLLGGSTVVAGAISSPIAVPLAVLGAGGWFAVNKLYRHNMLEKSRLQTEIPRLSQAERAIIADYVDTRIRSLKPELVTSYRVQLQESLTRVQQLLRERQAQEQQSAQATQQRIDGLRREVRLVENQLAAVDGSLVKLHGE